MSFPLQVTAVIPSWNARARLPQVLAILADEVAETVVVDNGSTDGTAAWLRANHPNVHLVANEDNRGWPAAINQGVAAASELRAEAVLLLNDDCVPEPGAVAAMVDALLAEPGLGAVTPRLLYADRPGVLNSTGSLWHAGTARVTTRGEGEPDDGRYADAHHVDAPSGACCLIRMAALCAIGPFDEAWFLYYDDLDWGLRAAEGGWPTAYVPAAAAQHGGSIGTAAHPERRRYYNVRNRLLFARRHATLVGMLRAHAESILDLPLQALRALSRRPARRADARARWHGLRDALRGHMGRSERYG